MIYNIEAPQQLNSEVSLPASKSISNRALILQALSYSPQPHNLSDCDDTRVLLQVFDSESNRFDIGAAGTSMRFLTAYLSKIGGLWQITGSERMKKRPIGILVDALRQCGAKIDYLENEGFPPLQIQGRALIGGEIHLKGNVSSQFISALLMIAPTMRDGLTLFLEGDIISAPYIRMTLALLEKFGIQSKWEDNCIRIDAQDFQETQITVEADWSAASYWYEMILFDNTPTNNVRLNGLLEKSIQGDARIADFFQQLGVTTVYTKDGITISCNPKFKQPELIELDLSDQPDLAQTLVVSCIMKGIHFRFTGLQSLKIKETDRINALKQELKKLGYVLHDADNSILYWNGERCEAQKEIIIDTYEDHRMAMAFAPVAKIVGSIEIRNPHVVSKSYPHFWNDLNNAGFSIKPRNIEE